MYLKAYVPLIDGLCFEFIEDLETISVVLKDLFKVDPVIIYSAHNFGMIAEIYMPDDHPVGILLSGPRSPLFEKGWTLYQPYEP